MSKVHNHTHYTLAEIRTFPKLGTTVNKWRGRNIDLYQHPSRADHVISVGITFDGEMTVVVSEPKTDWATALDYAAHGKVYVSE